MGPKTVTVEPSKLPLASKNKSVSVVFPSAPITDVVTSAPAMAPEEVLYVDVGRLGVPVQIGYGCRRSYAGHIEAGAVSAGDYRSGRILIRYGPRARLGPVGVELPTVASGFHVDVGRGFRQSQSVVEQLGDLVGRQVEHVDQGIADRAGAYPTWSRMTPTAVPLSPKTVSSAPATCWAVSPRPARIVATARSFCAETSFSAVAIVVGVAPSPARAVATATGNCALAQRGRTAAEVAGVTGIHHRHRRVDRGRRARW